MGKGALVLRAMALQAALQLAKRYPTIVSSVAASVSETPNAWGLQAMKLYVILHGIWRGESKKGTVL